MKKIYYFSIVPPTALYVVTVFATAFLGFLHPLCWVGFPVVAAILGAPSYLCVASRWQRFGVGTLLPLALALFLLATGEGGLLAFVIAIVAGLLSDVLRLFAGNTSKKGTTIAYPILSLGVIGWILPLWTRTQWYHEGAVEEMGADYAEGLMPLAQWWVLLLLVIATMVVGYSGIRLAISWLKGTASRFEEQPGLLSKFWNTNARPQGWCDELPYENAKFDLVTAYETVYFWPDLKKAFSEVFRVLKPHGIFTFSYGDESSSTMRYWANEIEAMRILPADEISQLLADVGFADLQIARKGGYTINFRIRKA